MKAIDNIGVNPGAVGILTSGGEHLIVEDNIMYSEKWLDPINGEGSNVAFSSYHFCDQFYGSGMHSCGPCNDHNYVNNEANWKNWEGNLNRAWASDTYNCGISNSQILNSTIEDLSIDENIWYQW